MACLSDKSYIWQRFWMIAAFVFQSEGILCHFVFYICFSWGHYVHQICCQASVYFYHPLLDLSQLYRKIAYLFSLGLHLLPLTENGNSCERRTTYNRPIIHLAEVLKTYIVTVLWETLIIVIYRVEEYGD